MVTIYEKREVVRVRPATAADGEAVRAIRNHAVATSTALWTDTRQSPADAGVWLAAHLARGSALVAELGGEVVGFAVYGPWRDLDGYRHTVENSVYVREDSQGLGIGRALLGALVDAARGAGHHSMIAGIESGNATSIRLHRRFGFTEVGTVPEAGLKFGRWFDLTIMRLALED
ncbi:N-acetyltransferase family protein [Streptomyces sp. NPDC006622]|uniref:GNAT family N-acetyltransferase n=1 Tax=Streptomyces sp. NPDC006622 TaxID=3155459 RepID=UPI0033A353A0